MNDQIKILKVKKRHLTEHYQIFSILLVRWTFSNVLTFKI